MSIRATARWICAAAMLVAAACAPPPAAPDPLEPDPPVDGLRVVTWNLLGSQGDALVFDEQAGWAARVDQLQPDVLVLQEAQADDVSAILTRTTNDYRLAVHVPWECDLKPNTEGVAIVVKGSLTLLGAGGTHVGQSCFDPTVRRILAWADVEVGGAPFRVYGTHLTAGSSGPSSASRDAQIRAIRSIIAAADPDDDRRWLLAGDLNAAPGEPSYELVVDDDPDTTRADGMVDTFAELSPVAVDVEVCPTVPAGDATAMAHLWAHPELVAACGYTAGWPKDSDFVACDLLSQCTSWQLRRDRSVRERIDHVMRPEGGPIEVLAGRVPNRTDPDWASPGAEWFRLSDHLPYVVDLAVEPAGGG